MDMVRLGRSGLKVSRLCLGCMSFGTPGGPTHPWALDEAASMPFFRMAIEKGINFFDTANLYNHGASEIITGKALKDYARRDEIVVATKVGLAMGKHPNLRGLSRKHIVEQVEQSLKRLQMDHVDLLYIHRLDADTPMEEIIEGLDLVVRQGKVIYPAASSMWTWQFAKMREMQKASGMVPFVAMQNFYNLLYREEEREMMPYCASEGVGVVPWSPIARGFLAGNRPRGGEATNRGKTDPMSADYFGSRTDYAITARVAEIAEKHGVSPAMIAYAWVLSKPFVTAPIVGVTKIGQLEEAIAALDVTLTASDIRQLEALYKVQAPKGHS